MKLKKFEKEIETILKDYEVYVYVDEYNVDEYNVDEYNVDEYGVEDYETVKYVDIKVMSVYEETFLNVTIKSEEKEEFLKVLREIEGRFDFSFRLEGGLEDLKEFLEATKIALSCYKFH